MALFGGLNKCESVSKPAGSLHVLGMTISILDWIAAHKDGQWASRTAARWPFTPDRLAYKKIPKGKLKDMAQALLLFLNFSLQRLSFFSFQG